MAASELLIGAVLLGLAAGFVAAVIRTAAPTSWKMTKPVGCPTCMGFWSTLLVITALAVTGARMNFLTGESFLMFALQVAAACGIAAWLNGQLVQAPLMVGVSPGDLAALDELAKGGSDGGSKS